VRYLKTAVDYSYYYSLPAQWIASVSLREGYIIGISQDVGISDRFFLGGSSFRGFQPGGVGPRDRATGDSLGGNIFYVGTGEVTFPLGLPSEYGILGRMFAMAGSLAQVDEGGTGLVDIGSIRVSSGFGLSWRSPLGPVRVDYSIPLVKEDFDETEAFRFSFGTRF
jgi:outer membrane protein insertion porin family